MVSRISGATELRRKLTALEERVIPAARVKAVNRVANTVRARSAPDIAQATGLKVSVVRRRIVVRKRASRARPVAEVVISGNPFNLIEFVVGAKKPRAQKCVSNARRKKWAPLKSKAWGAPNTHAGLFVARMPNGSIIVVKRVRGARTRSGKSSAVRSAFGPGIAREANEPLLRARREAVVKERMPIEMRYALRVEVQSIVKRGAR